MTYIPTGAAGRALEFIRENGPQFTGPLAEHLGVRSCDVSSLLAYAVQRGALKKDSQLVDGRLLAVYSVGNGTPVDRPKDEPLHEQPATAGAPPPKVRKQRKPKVEVLPEPATCTESQTEPFACGLFSDGRLVLEMPERTVLLKPEWTSKLMAFLRTAPGVSA